MLCGPSGGGKSTLLKLLKPELTPVGTKEGSVFYKNRPLHQWEASLTAAEIGMVFQNPEAQPVMDTVEQELAFGMENLGLAPALMRSRLAEVSALFGLEPLLSLSVHELSGGQKQLLNLAAVLALHPKLLLLDEPTSQLDPVAAREFIALLRRLNEELSMTIILSEHRLEEALPLADRVLLLENGELRATGAPRELVRMAGREESAFLLPYLPPASRLYLAFPETTDEGDDRQEASPAPGKSAVPLTIREGKAWLRAMLPAQAAGAAEEDFKNGLAGQTGLGLNHESARAAKRSFGSSLIQDGQEEKAQTAPLLTCSEVTFRYERDKPDVLKRMSLSVRGGELLAILGGNGAGKSTLLQLMAGLMKPQRGKLTRKAGVKAAYLAQNPLLYFSRDTVMEEMLQMADYGGLGPEQAKRDIDVLLQKFGLDSLAGSHPLDLSGGQQQKTALAMVLLLRPDVLLLDEPTKGLDPLAKEKLAQELLELAETGMGVVMVTHDVEFAARYASRCAMLFGGAITAEGTPGTFFPANYFYTTSVNRMVRDWLPEALTVEDVKARW